MTEKELLVQLTTTQLREIIEYPKASYNDLLTGFDQLLKTPQEMNELNDKLIAFLVEKSNLSVLLDKTITGQHEKFKAPSFIHQIQLYDSKRLQESYKPDGSLVPPNRTRKFNGEFIMDVPAYYEQRLNDLLPELVESYPLQFATELYNKTKSEEVRQHVRDFIEQEYIAPLKETLPGIEVAYDISSDAIAGVVFKLDLTNVKDIAARASIATGQFNRYRIELV